jgi:hypothetical protein
VSALRQVLEEVRSGRARGLDDLARRVGVSRDEASAMVDHWVRKGRLDVADLSAACSSGGCGSCPSGDHGSPGCGAGDGRPVLLAISVRPPG